jgi:predicted transposase/invertase (TIGR01784 family)
MWSMKKMPPEYRGSYLEKMFDLSNFASMDEKSQREYLARFMWEVDQRSQLRTAKEEGIAEGHAEGHAEGLREAARRMLADGVDSVLVQKYTGLPSDDIHSL